MQNSFPLKSKKNPSSEMGINVIYLNEGEEGERSKKKKEEESVRLIIILDGANVICLLCS